MIRTVTPAPLHDVIALFEASNGALKPWQFKTAMLQAARSETIGWYGLGEDGYGSERLLAAAFLYPSPPELPGEDLRELAFVCRPEIARHLVPLIHTAQSAHAHLRASARPDDPALRIRAWVRTGHLPGERLAALCGLAPAGTSGAFTRWELEISRPCASPTGTRSS